MGAPAIPELLLPLFEESRIVEGGDEALRVSIALREALNVEGHCMILRAQKDLCVAQVSTVEGDFNVRAHESGFMARVSMRRFGASAKEWRALWQCIDRNVSCARPVALLTANDGRADYLVTERSSLFTPLPVWLEREHGQLMSYPALARAFAAGLAACIAALHRAGALPLDMDPSQFAVRPPRPGTQRFEFQLLEISADALASVADESRRLRSLGAFLLGFSRWPATLKLRFARDYRALLGDARPERDWIHAVVGNARQRQFDLDTLLVAHCAEASAMQAVVKRDGILLVVRRTVAPAGLAELEELLARSEAAQWESVLTGHFESRVEDGVVCRTVHAAAERKYGWDWRRIEASWGRLCELEAIGARVPKPLACVADLDALVVLGKVGGRLESLAAHRHDRDWRLVDQLARELARYHAFGLYFLPAAASQTLAALSVSVAPGGVREFVLTGQDQLFRGQPSQLGAQAVASLGRVARALGEGLGERALKELVWAYARAMFLKPDETKQLMEEALRVPSGRTLVMTRGIERRRLQSEARP